MKVACDRCLKTVDADNQKIPNDWLSLTSGSGFLYIFCKECSEIFWDAMFSDNFEERKDGEINGKEEKEAEEAKKADEIL